MKRFQKYALLVCMLAGCASYQARPLPMKADWPEGLNRLKVDQAAMPMPELAAHRFDPEDGLDMTEVAMIAVANNPQLKLARDDAGISGAQAYAAGLLPDPQFSFSPQFPQNGIPGENVTAFDLGLSYNFGAIVTHSLQSRAARASLRQADLILLWKEWQVVGQARLLFSRLCAMRNELGIMRARRRLAAMRHVQEKTALQHGDLALPGVVADENALQGIDNQIVESERMMEKDRYALNALLGLSPHTRLQLVQDTEIPILDREKIAGRLAGLSSMRPDLMALRAGYDAQDMRLRLAILSQFPAIQFGLVRARDNTGINYEGVSLSLSLPIFNRNRGNIAVARATRARLHDEFQIRLNAAYSDVEQILSDQRLLEAQLAQLSGVLTNLERLSVRAESAYKAGDMDLAAYSSLKDAALSKKAEKYAIEESIFEERIALLTLLGGQLPVKESE